MQCSLSDIVSDSLMTSSLASRVTVEDVLVTSLDDLSKNMEIVFEEMRSVHNLITFHSCPSYHIILFALPMFSSSYQ